MKVYIYEPVYRCNEHIQTKLETVIDDVVYLHIRTDCEESHADWKHEDGLLDHVRIDSGAEIRITT